MYQVLSQQIVQGAFGPDYAVQAVFHATEIYGSSSPYAHALLRCLCTWLATLPVGPNAQW